MIQHVELDEHIRLGKLGEFHLLHFLPSQWCLCPGFNSLDTGFLSDGRQKFTPVDPAFGSVLYDTVSGWSVYHVGALTLRKEFNQHFSLLNNYVYGKSIDIATENQLQDEPQDYLQPQLDRAVSDNDVRHRLVVTVLAESPETSATPLRSFQFSILNTLQSAQSYSILAGSTINGDGFTFNDRVGSIGRNTYVGAPYYDTDLRLQRLFSIGERLMLNASAEALNVLNRVNVQDVDQVYGTGEFSGAIPKRYGDGYQLRQSNVGSPTVGARPADSAIGQIQVLALTVSHADLESVMRCLVTASTDEIKSHISSVKWM